MHNDGEPPSANKRPEPNIDLASTLPSELGEKLRTLFNEVESQPIPDRLRELLEALAAREKDSE